MGVARSVASPLKRGRLLVSQYVHHHNEPGWRHSRAGIWAKRLMVTGVVLQLLLSLVAGVLGVVTKSWITPANAAATGQVLRQTFGLTIVLMTVPGLLMLSGGVFCVWQISRNAGPAQTNYRGDSGV